MALARFQFHVTDDAGNVVPTASVEVRQDVPGQPLVALFSDRDGAIGLANPFTADASGYAFFHVAGGAYQVKATLGGFQRIWRYVAVGTLAELDIESVIVTASDRSELERATRLAVFANAFNLT